MTFNSYIFILLFLPLCLAGYYLINYFLPYKCGLIFLLGMSLWFYGYFNIKYLAVIGISIISNYFIYKCLNNCDNKKNRKMIFWMGIIFNLGLLGYFKYFDFFIENINALFRKSLEVRNILLPLGISFFTFQQISFIMDVYREERGGYFLFFY